MSVFEKIAISCCIYLYSWLSVQSLYRPYRIQPGQYFMEIHSKVTSQDAGGSYDQKSCHVHDQPMKRISIILIMKDMPDAGWDAAKEICQCSMWKLGKNGNAHLIDQNLIGNGCLGSQHITIFRYCWSLSSYYDTLTKGTCNIWRDSSSMVHAVAKGWGWSVDERVTRLPPVWKFFGKSGGTVKEAPVLRRRELEWGCRKWNQMVQLSKE